MLTYDEVSGAAIFADDRTDRSAVVLILKISRISIVFLLQISYANILRSIRRLFRRHTDWIAAGQCTRNGNTFIVWQIDIVVCAQFFIATDVQVTGNVECSVLKIHAAARAVRACRGVSGDAAAVHCKRAFTLEINTAAITGCSITGDARRFENGHIITRRTIVT